MPASTSKKFQPKVQSKEDYEKNKKNFKAFDKIYTHFYDQTQLLAINILKNKIMCCLQNINPLPLSLSSSN